MFKTDLRTIAQVSAIAPAIKWGCPSVPASSQNLSLSRITRVPSTTGDRLLLLDRITSPHLDRLHSQKVQAQLPQFAETVQLERLAPPRCQVEMPELYARLNPR
ncbi:hypothetical protein NG796_01195 [Laspinema sp. A4]|nr:hypothetical protein [Laspinema sp. D2d]